MNRLPIIFIPFSINISWTIDISWKFERPC